MKKFALLSALIIPLLVVAGFIITDKAESKGSNSVTFYTVPLVCPGAPQIGCGTKSKPVLLGLEKQNNIVSEAWLNREGTAIAVLWSENASSDLRTTTADAIFKENKMDVKLVSGKDHEDLLAAFQKKTNWYQGMEVDKLSSEEEEIITERLLSRVNLKTPLCQEKTQFLQTEFVAALKNRFIKTFSSEVNSDPKVIENEIQEMNKEFLEIGKKYLNETEMNALKDAVALGMQPTESEKACCSKHGKEQSCSSK